MPDPADRSRSTVPIKRSGKRDPIEFVDGVIAEVKGAAPEAVLRAALILEGAIKQILLTPGTGRLYGKHRASAPGDPPAPDMGQLQRSITHEVVNDTTVRVGTPLKYADALEYGSLRRGGKTHPRAGRGALGARLGAIAPRPFMRPARASVKDEMGEGIVTTLRRKVRGKS